MLPFYKRAIYSLIFAALSLLAVESLLFLAARRLVFRPFECAVDRAGVGSCKYLWNEKTPPIATPKPPGVTRILVLGESAVKGWPFDGAGFPEQMQVMLDSSAGPGKFEVVNLGANGINTAFLREVLKRAIPLLKPDLVIICAGNNELLAHEAIDDLDHPALARGIWWLRCHSRIWNLPAAGAGILLSRGLAVDLMVRVTRMEDNYDKWLFPPQERDHVRELFLFHLQQMISICRENQTPVVLSTVGANLVDWVPMKSVHTPTLSPEARKKIVADLNQSRADLMTGAAGNDLPLLSKITQDDPDYAKGWFFLGKAQLQNDQDATGLLNLEQAVERADFFQEVPPSWNRGIRSIAIEQGIPLMDIDLAFRTQSPRGVAGFEYFVDGCHPSPAGHSLIAAEMISELIEKKFLAPTDQVPRKVSLALSQPALLGLAFFNQAMALAFLYPSPEYKTTAIQFLDQAADLGADRSLTMTYQGYLSILLARPQDAASYFSQARNANPALFAATVKTKLTTVTNLQDPWLWVKPATPEEMPSLYPGAGKTLQGQPPGPLACPFRFAWDGKEYRSAPIK